MASLFAFLGALTLVGCAAGAPTSSTGSTPAAPRLVGFQLLSQNGSGASGSAQLALTAGSSVTVTLHISGLPPNTVHPAHIHQGACGDNGPVVRALQDVVADVKGTATAVTQLDDFAYRVPVEGWYANVHAGPDLTGSNARSVVCGNLPVA